MIIGFAGQKKSGKSTAAGFLVDQGFVRHSFADPMRDMLEVLLTALGLSAAEIAACYVEKESPIYPLGVSIRTLLQTLGTDWGRALIDPDMWVNCEQERLEQLFTEERIVYDDIRFENEADLIRAYGGLVVHIKRTGLAGDDSHHSEAGIAVADADVVLHNDGNLGQLLDAVLALVDRVV